MGAHYQHSSTAAPRQQQRDCHCGHCVWPPVLPPKTHNRLLTISATVCRSPQTHTHTHTHTRGSSAQLPESTAFARNLHSAQLASCLNRKARGHLSLETERDRAESRTSEPPTDASMEKKKQTVLAQPCVASRGDRRRRRRRRIGNEQSAKRSRKTQTQTQNADADADAKRRFGPSSRWRCKLRDGAVSFLDLCFVQDVDGFKRGTVCPLDDGRLFPSLPLLLCCFRYTTTHNTQHVYIHKTWLLSILL